MSEPQIEFGYATLAQLVESRTDGTDNFRSSHRPIQSIAASPDLQKDAPCFFYLGDRGKILSSYYVFPDIFWENGETRPWVWAGDLYTDPACRGKGLATRLTRESVDVLHSLGYAWGGVFATPAALRIYQNLGFVVPGYAERRLLFKTARPLLEYRSSPNWLSRPVDLLYRTSFGPVATLLSRPSPHCRIMDKDAIVDNLPEPIYQEKYHFNDSPAKLKWKLAGQDAVLHIIEDATHSPASYVITKTRRSNSTFAKDFGAFSLMTVMDFGMFSTDVMNHTRVLRAVLSLFLDSNAQVLEFMSSSKRMNREARKRGMFKVGKGMPFIFAPPPDWNLHLDTADISNWHLTHFSGDAFGFG